MCETCGCSMTSAEEGNTRSISDRLDVQTVEVLRDLLHENDRAAAHNREHFDRHGVFVVNVVSGPGAGKTSLLEATIDALHARAGAPVRVAVIEGDLATENDAERIRRHGAPALQIQTGTTCHLDADMVHVALHGMSLEGIDVLFIENVGNLVCPASFDLGQHANVALLSVPEGDDKPAKYPVLFRGADVVLLSKADLLEHIPECKPERVARAVRDLGSDAPVLEIAARTGAGVDAWIDWLLAHRAAAV